MASLLWSVRNELQAEEEAGTESRQESRIMVHNRDVYVWKAGREERVFVKVGQFDTEEIDWGVDAKGMLWALPFGETVMKVKVVEK